MLAGRPRWKPITRSLVALLVVGAIGCEADRRGGVLPPAVQLLVSDETGGHVLVIDPARGEVVQRVYVGKRPRGLRVSPDGQLLYVALSGSPIGGPSADASTLGAPDRAADGIGIVDLTTGTLMRLVQSGPAPETFDVSPDGRMLYVSNEDSAQMTALDLRSGQIVRQVRVGEEPEGVRVRPDGQVVYVTCEGTNDVAVVDAASYMVIARVKTEGRPRAIEFTADGRTAFISNETGGSISVLDAQTHTVTGVIPIPAIPGAPTPPRPMGLVLSPDGSRLYVALGRARAVAVIDVSRSETVQTFTGVGTRPWGIAISPDGTQIYTANSSSGDVSVINVATGRIERRILTGGSPWGISVVRAR